MRSAFELIERFAISCVPDLISGSNPFTAATSLLITAVVCWAFTGASKKA